MRLLLVAGVSLLLLTGCAKDQGIVDGPVPVGGDHWRTNFAQAVREKDAYWAAESSDGKIAQLGTNYCTALRLGEDPALDGDDLVEYPDRAKDHVEVVFDLAHSMICPTY